MTNNPVHLRPVTHEDQPFLYRLYASTRSEELSAVPWSEEQKQAFLKMQFSAQSHDYRKNYPDAALQLIVRDGQPAGRLYLDRRERAICIVDIALLPEHRRAGIGSALLRELIAEANAAGKPLTLHVEKFNPARRLYQRLGFVETGDNGVYLQMERVPEPAGNS